MNQKNTLDRVNSFPTSSPKPSKHDIMNSIKKNPLQENKFSFFTESFKSLNLLGKGSLKGQSAMEYLMTYGWSILLITIALIALFELGFFQSGGSLPITCIAEQGFLCNNPSMNTTGNFSVTFGEALGSPLTISGLGCSNSSIEPTNWAFKLIPLYPGQPTQITFKCPVSGNSVGSTFGGVLWIRYNQNSVDGQISKVATVSAKISTTGKIGVQGGNGNGFEGAGVAYVTNYYGGTSGHGNVILLNPTTGQLISSIDFNGSTFDVPGQMAIYGNTEYVVNTQGGMYRKGNVTIINLATKSVIGNIDSPMFYYPSGINISGTTAYVVNSGGGVGGEIGNVLIINLLNNQITGAIDSAPSPFYKPGAIATFGNVAYIFNTFDYNPYTSSNITLLNTLTNNVIKTIPSYAISSAAAVAISGSTAYIVNRYGGTYYAGNIMEFDLTNNQILSTSINLPEFRSPDGIAISGSTAYIVNSEGGSIGTGNVVLVNLANGNFITGISSSAFDYPTGIGIYGSNVIISNGYASNILIINMQTNSISSSISTPGLGSGNLAVYGSNAFISNYYGTADRLNLITHQITQISNAIPTNGQTSGIAVSGNIGYIVNPSGGPYGTGNISVFNTLSNQVTGSLGGPSYGFYNPTNIAVSGSTGTGYVINKNTQLLTFSIPSKTVTGTLNAGGAFCSPSGIALSGSSTGYITNKCGGTYNTGNLIELNLLNDQVTNTIDYSTYLGCMYPLTQNLAISGATAYILNVSQNSCGSTSSYSDLITLDLTTNTVLGTTPLTSSQLSGEALYGSTLYVSNPFGGAYNTGNILLFNTISNTITSSIGPSTGFSNPSSMVISGTTGYVLNGASVTEVNITDNKITGSFDNLALANPSGFAISGQNLYIVNNNGDQWSAGGCGSGNITVINIPTGITSGINDPDSCWYPPQEFDYPSAIAISGSMAYVINSQGGYGVNGCYNGYGNITAIDLSNNQYTGINPSSCPFSNPTGIAILGNNAYVVNSNGGNSGTGNIIILNLSTYEVTNSIESSSFTYPTSIYINGTYAYVQNQNGFLIFNLTNNLLQGTISSSSFDDPSSIAVP